MAKSKPFPFLAKLFVGVPGTNRCTYRHQPKWKPHAFNISILIIIGLSSVSAFSKTRVDGEYGLWVKTIGSEVTVHWMTSTPDSGWLSVKNGNTTLNRYKTAPGYAHKASFLRTNNDPLLLEYGTYPPTLENLFQTTLYPERPAESAPVEVSTVDSIYVVGDIHGHYDHVKQLLSNADLIDAQNNWNGTHDLVFLGDYFGRGKNVTKVLWFLYKLDHQARRSGGRVHVLLGNHELLIPLNDLRYTSGKEQLIAQYHSTTYPQMFDFHQSILGRWLRKKPPAIRIGSILFAHGGICSKLDMSLSEMADSLRQCLEHADWQQLHQCTTGARLSASQEKQYDFLFGSESVFWFRDYILEKEAESCLEKSLERFGAKRQVLGHTPLKQISALYGGRIIGVDLSPTASEMLLLSHDDPASDHRAFRILLDGNTIELPLE